MPRRCCSSCSSPWTRRSPDRGSAPDPEVLGRHIRRLHAGATHDGRVTAIKTRPRKPKPPEPRGAFRAPVGPGYPLTSCASAELVCRAESRSSCRTLGRDTAELGCRWAALARARGPGDGRSRARRFPRSSRRHERRAHTRGSKSAEAHRLRGRGRCQRGPRLRRRNCVR